MKKSLLPLSQIASPSERSVDTKSCFAHLVENVSSVLALKNNFFSRKCKIFLFVWSLQSLYVSYAYSYKNQINFTFISENLQKIQLFQHPYFFVMVEPSTSISQCIALSLNSLSLLPPPFCLSLTYPFLFLYPVCSHIRFCSEISTKPGLCGCPPFFLSAIPRNRLLEGLYEREMHTMRRNYFKTHPHSTQNVYRRHRLLTGALYFFKVELLIPVNIQIMTLRILRFVIVTLRTCLPDFNPETGGSELLPSAGTSLLNYTDTNSRKFYCRFGSNCSVSLYLHLFAQM